jgi:uncharacterized protein
MSNTFLKANWRKLIMANYICDPALLQKLIPIKTELDLYKGRCYLSLVGFMFYDTRVMKLTIPYHKDFEEVNLRFYVRYKYGEKWKRGVVFIKEIVPRHAITFFANHLYGEHYQTLQMKHSIMTEENISVSYQWNFKNKWNNLSVIAQRQSIPITPGSENEFITEHYWGYTRINERKSLEYEVVHPKWEHYPVIEYNVDVDHKAVYGTKFGFLNHSIPASVLLAEGSPVQVKKGSVI